MPSAKEHQEKADENRAFLSQLLASNGDSKWIAIVAFYTAVHLAERLAACENVHNSNHPDRLNYLSKHKKHKAIHANFLTLYDASLIARYGTVNQFQKAFSSIAVTQLVDTHLAAIEAYVKAFFLPPLPPGSAALPSPQGSGS